MDEKKGCAASADCRHVQSSLLMVSFTVIGWQLVLLWFVSSTFACG